MSLKNRRKILRGMTNGVIKILRLGTQSKTCLGQKEVGNEG